jgi:phosphatidylglycerol---prolipoprotein diacylglyceryl transferase
MLTYPHFDPVALQFGALKIHWYGIMYIVGFLSAWGLGTLRARRSNSIITKDQISDLIFFAALGVVIGGRVGYMLFYNFSDFLAQPWSIIAVWQGGMSFHGGLIGVLIAVYLFSRKIQQPFMALMDFIAPLVPIGLAAGRLGNFINGELWGRVTTAPWGMIFPNGGPLPRHPSELYEFLMEGVLLFIILWLYSSKPRPRMAVSGLFAVCYGIFRIIAECFRQPDIQLGYIAFGWLTQGQLLSIPLVIIGIVLFTLAYRKK